jgi:hypothetical protein
LVLVSSLRSTQATGFTDPLISFNSSTANFSARRLGGAGSFVFSDSVSRTIGVNPASNATTNTFGNGEVTIPNYSSGLAKSFATDNVSENNGTESYQMITAGLWNDSAAITSITLTPGAGNFAEHSSATLYGILKGSDGITTVT